MKKTNNSIPETAIHRSITAKIIESKEEWISEQCHIEKGRKEGKSNKAVDTLKRLTRKQQTKTSKSCINSTEHY